MTPANACSECGKIPSEFSVEGLCPRCVAMFAFGQPEDPPAPELSPRKCRGYDLLEEIARGGMGVVFRARQRSLNRVVAVKMILAGQFASEANIRRFKAEAAAVAELRHPNIVAIHEVGEEEGHHFFSMDYVEGIGLDALAAREPIEPRRAAFFLRQIADAIDHAHRRGILHRDLKPSNILIDASDEPRVTDFGLARRLSGHASVTMTGQMVGTPGFIAPEQAGGAGATLGPSSDIYSLGAILYFALARKPPFAGRTIEETLHKVFTEEPTPVRRLNPKTPIDLATICGKCLAKNPGRRYGSAAEVREDLDRFLEGKPIRARARGPLDRAWRFGARHKLVCALTAALFVLSVILLSMAAREQFAGTKPASATTFSPATSTAPGLAGLRRAPDKLIAPSMPLLSASGASGVIDGRLFVVTGLDGNAGMRAYLHLYDPATNGWSVLPEPPVTRSGPAFGVIAGKFYVAGGFSLEGLHSRLDVYDPAAGKWLKKKDMPTARTGSAGAVLNGDFYVIGGSVGTNVLDRVDVYDPVTDIWRASAPLPAPRGASTAATVGGAIYVIGGHDDFHTESRNSVFVFDLATGKWSSRTQMLVPRSNAASVVFENKIYICGGFYGGESASFLCYDPQTDHWRAMPSMPAPRYQGDGAQILNGRIWVIGGWNTVRPGQSLPAKTILVYDPRSGAWSESVNRSL